MSQSSELKQVLRGVMLFAGLSDTELETIAAICKERKLGRGEVLAEQGAPGDDFFVVTNGFLEISVAGGDNASQVLVNLGKGQIIGEMALIDQGPRSATVRAVSEAVVQVIHRGDFEALCDKNTRIGYIVMKDIAADLSFKLRHRNMTIG
ncbi:MAG: cyclic nucleotide-binding domain-containing protein [Anaerolineales bacterium]|nr:cyclic nucleotide-binding domain-containing protein [Anaerolineales bacterium]